MYQMLSGHRPFEADNMFEAAAQKLAAKPEPLSAYIDIGRDWERLIARCLERDRAARFQTAAEFLTQVRILSLRRRRWSGMRRWNLCGEANAGRCSRLRNSGNDPCSSRASRQRLQH